MAGARLPFHADHIGSILRPASLSKAQQEADAGDISQAQLHDVQQAAIRDIVQKQLDHGVRPLTSGEFDRKYYWGGFFEKLGGFHEISPVPWDLARLSAPPIAALKKAGQQYPMAAVCNGKITHEKSAYLNNWRMLRDSLPKEQWAQCKFTMPPPCYFHLRLAEGKSYSKEVYSSDEGFFTDLTKAYRKEMKVLFDEGLRNLQIDDPTMAYFCSEDMLEGLRSDGVDPDKMFDTISRRTIVASRTDQKDFTWDFTSAEVGSLLLWEKTQPITMTDCQRRKLFQIHAL